MEEEIDLRQYIQALFKYKFWILGLAFVAALVGLGGSFLISPTYQATALVAITEPRYTMQFDSRFSTDDVQPPYKAYLDLAMGDALLAALIEDLGNALEAEEQSVQVLSEMLQATNGSDPSIVLLKVENGDRKRTPLIANRWAELFVNHVNELYGQSQADLTFFDEQLAETQETLDQSEQDLIAFQANNPSAILEAQLNDRQAALQAYLDAARSLELLIQDAQSLQRRLRDQDATTPVSLGDELAVLLLTIDMQAENELPIQLQVSGQQPLSDITAGEQLALLDALIQALQNKLEIMGQEAEAVEPQILSLQEALEQAKAQNDRLVLAKNVAQETVLTLTRKAAEARIAAQDEGGNVRLASAAAVPDKPVSPRIALNTAIAGALGLFLGVLGAFAIEYWQEGKSKTNES